MSLLIGPTKALCNPFVVAEKTPDHILSASASLSPKMQITVFIMKLWKLTKKGFKDLC